MKLSGASSATVAALFIVGIILGSVAVYGLGLSSTSSTVTKTGAGSTVTVGGNTLTQTVTTTAQGASCGQCLLGLNETLLQGSVQAAGNLSGTMTIGVLDDLTSQLAGEGVTVQATTGFAIHDINAWLQSTRLAGKVTFQTNLQDYALDNTKATNIMNSFLAAGIHVVVGPLNSGTAGALLPLADSNHMVMISPSSTNPAISYSGDYLYRTPPADSFQAQADSAEFIQSGVQAVITVYRNDGYGQGLANATDTVFTAAGGHVVTAIPYDTTTSNFQTLLATINDAYNTAKGTYGAQHVALYFISFNEFGQIATQAESAYGSDSGSFFNSPLPWFGTDGEGNEAPIVNSTYASAVVTTRLAASFPGFSQSALTTSVCARELAAISVLCDGYAIGAYDDTWLAALAILYCGPFSHGQDGVCMRDVLPAISAGFPGASGVPILNTGGDRLYASYVFFCIVPGSTAGTAKWIVCGTWDQASNKVIWSAKPSGIP